MVRKYIEVNGKSYPVHLVDVQRRFETLDKYAYRTEDGILHRSCIGIYRNYNVTVGIEDDIDLYDSLMDALSAPVNSMMIKLPDEDVAQDRYIGSLTDKVSRVTERGTIYKELSFNIICVAPTRKG